MRIKLSADPMLQPQNYMFEGTPWSARWIGHPAPVAEQSVVDLYRCDFDLPAARTLRFHVSADQRYQLFLDGQRIGLGPERGTHENWFYESYELQLAPGRHTLAALTWWILDRGRLRAWAQISAQPAFLLQAEGDADALVSTRVAPWRVRRVPGYTMVPPQIADAFAVTGARQIIDARQGPALENLLKQDDGWDTPAVVSYPGFKAQPHERQNRWILRPALLPAMLEQTVRTGVTRHAQIIPLPADPLATDCGKLPVQQADHQSDIAAACDAMLAGKSPLTLPPRTAWRLLIDLGDYYCAYPQLTLAGGRAAVVRLSLAETLFDKLRGWDKGHRDQIEGKYFRGPGDTYISAGETQRTFEPLWWLAGRYVELIIVTADQPLTIQGMALRETHYPHRFEDVFAAADDRLARITPIARRALEMCSHETYMDCPHYEQLMYVGDTRLQALVTYVATRDDSLPRKALEMFDESRLASGLTQSRTPSYAQQVIPTFALWWVNFVHDFASWRNDDEFVAARLPGIRAVLDAFRGFRNVDGLVESPLGWNYVDWVPTWPKGMPPGAENAVNSIVNLQFVLALQAAAELEQAVGDELLAQRYRRDAQQLAQALWSAFFQPARALLADTPRGDSFSEHAQCLALLAGIVPEAQRSALTHALFAAPDLARTTIYFSHYLFETCAKVGRMDTFFQRLELWYDLLQRGLRTTVESPEPTRSDCHAWGAHPVYHYYASVLGIRPAALGFTQVVVRPQLGPLTWAEGILPHPSGGVIHARLERDGSGYKGFVELPTHLTGTLMLPAGNRPLHAGRNDVA